MAALRVDGRYIVFLAGFLGTIVWGSSGFRQFVQDPNFKNVICSGPPLLFNVRSDRVKCVLTCYRHALCKAVFFNNCSQTCDGFSETMSISSVCTPQLGTECIVLNKVPYGDECGGRVGCLGNNMECWDSVCTCTPGYSYLPRDNSCVANCTAEGGAYGSTYQVYPGYVLHVYENGFVNVTLERCLAKCTNDNGCSSVCMTNDTVYCYTQSESALTYPSHFHLNSRYSHYHRNCE